MRETRISVSSYKRYVKSLKRKLAKEKRRIEKLKALEVESRAIRNQLDAFKASLEYKTYSYVNERERHFDAE